MESYTPAPYPADQKAAEAYPQQPYPPQPQGGAYPPPYAAQQQPVMMQPPAPQQQQSVNIQMQQMQQQQTVVVTGGGSSGSGALTLAIIMSIVSFFCGTWPIIFSLAGICLALAANDASNEESATSLSKFSKACSGGAMLAIAVEWVIFIITISVVVSAANSATSVSSNRYN